MEGENWLEEWAADNISNEFLSGLLSAIFGLLGVAGMGLLSAAVVIAVIYLL